MTLNTLDIHGISFRIEKNVVSYSYNPGSIWDIITKEESLDTNTLDENVYLILDRDNVDSNAFGHWVLESCVFVKYYSELKNIYPNLKVVLKDKRDFKILFLKYLGLEDTDIIYTLETVNPSHIEFHTAPLVGNRDRCELPQQFNTCIFPPFFHLSMIEPLPLWHSSLIKDFMALFHKEPVEKTIPIVFLPRQTKENFACNERSYPTEDIQKYILDLDPLNVILNTDSISDLNEQIRILQKAKIVVLTDGSPAFINQLFTIRSKVVVLGKSFLYAIHSKRDTITQALLNESSIKYGNQLVYSDSLSLDDVKEVLHNKKMRLLMNTHDYHITIDSAIKLTESYDKSVLFHCYWNGTLNEKHLYSVKSCYYFNVYKNKHKIILWLDNNSPNEYNTEIEKYAEIRHFNLNNERKGTFLEFDNNYMPEEYNLGMSFYSDYIRYLILYKYGGCYFDLDCLFLRSFDPVFYNFENEICVYTWEKQPYPNGAIFISLEPYSEKMKANINFIKHRRMGWSFQLAGLTFDLPLDMLVLPCSWFDGSWLEDNPYNIHFHDIFKATDKKYDLKTFFTGAFCYHWHNDWDLPVDDTSIFKQLTDEINSKLDLTRSIHFCSFGNIPKYSIVINQLLDEARLSGYFNTVKGYNQNDIPEEYQEFMRLNGRGCGFWIWKPIILLDMMEKTQPGDIIIYADAACSISTTENARSKFKEWIHDVESHSTHRLSFQMNHLPAEDWTKADLFEVMGCQDDMYRKTGQHSATIQLYKNTKENIEFIKEYLRIMSLDTFHYITDEPSFIPNADTFKDYRHDQSVLSLLFKKHGSSSRPDHWADPIDYSYPILTERRKLHLIW